MTVDPLPQPEASSIKNFPEPLVADNISTAQLDTVVTGISVTLIGRFGGRFFQLANQVLMARILGAADFGIFSIGWTILRMVGMISPLGLDRGVLRYASKYWNKDASRLTKVVRTSLKFSTVSGLLATVLFAAISPWLGNAVFKKPDLTPVLFILSLSFFFYTVMRVAASATEASQKMQYSVFVQDLFQPIFSLGFFIIFVLLGHNLLGAAASTALSILGVFLLSLHFLKKLIKPSQTPSAAWHGLARELVSFSIPASLSGIFIMNTVWVDRLIVGYYLPESDAGVYQAVSQFSILFSTILSAFNSIMVPVVANLYFKGDLGAINRLYKINTKWALMLSMPAYLITLLLSYELMTTIFGREYSHGWLPLVILTSGQFVNTATGAVSHILVMTGNQKVWSLISGFCLLTNIVANLILVPIWGLAGAAAGTSLSVVILYISGVLLARNKVAVWPYDHKYIKILLAIIPPTIILLLGKTMMPSAPEYLRLILLSGLSSVAYLLTIVLLGLEREDKDFLALLRKKIFASSVNAEEKNG